MTDASIHQGYPSAVPETPSYPPMSCAWCRKEFPQREEEFPELRKHIQECEASPLASALMILDAHDSLLEVIEATLKVPHDNSTAKEWRHAAADVFEAINELRKARTARIDHLKTAQEEAKR